MTSMELFKKFIESLDETAKKSVESYNISGGGAVIYLFDLKDENGETIQFAFTELGNLSYVDTY